MMRLDIGAASELYVLHDLWNRDKHRVLNLVVAVGNVCQILYAMPDGTIRGTQVIEGRSSLFEKQLKLGEYQGHPVRKFTFSEGGSRYLFGENWVPDQETVIFFGHAQDPESLESATAKAAWLDEAPPVAKVRGNRVVHLVDQPRPGDRDRTARLDEPGEVIEVQVVRTVIEEGIDGNDGVEEVRSERQHPRVGVDWEDPVRNAGIPDALEVLRGVEPQVGGPDLHAEFVEDIARPMCGYPATGAGVVLSGPEFRPSPFTRSVTMAGDVLGATRASSSNLFIVASIPPFRDRWRFVRSAARYSLSVSGPLASAFTKVSWPKYGISLFLLRS
jgi:hypothetical protein